GRGLGSRLGWPVRPPAGPPRRARGYPGGGLRRLGGSSGTGGPPMTAITLALPSKGRIQEEAIAIFDTAGLPIGRPGGARSYLGEMAAMPDVTVRFLSASEIARELIRGTIDIGVTGEDLIHETAESGPAQVEIAKRLGFG